MFTEANRVQIRKWLGFPAIYISADPRLESVITAVQSSADGGSRPDNTTELAILATLAKLTSLDGRLMELSESFEADTVDELRVDPIRAMYGVKNLMRMNIGQLADALAIAPLRDVLTPKASLHS